MRNYYNYFTEVEEYFLRRRGKNVLVSPLDWCLIELWKETGIPLQVVFQGIDRSFESARKRSRKDPTTLFYCHPAVSEVFEEYGRARLGAPAENQFVEENGAWARDDVRRYICGLERSVAARSGELFDRAGAQLSEIRSGLESGQGNDFEGIDRALNRVGSLIAESLQEELPAPRLKEIKKEVRSELKLYKKRLSKEVYRQLERSYLNRRIREEHHLPEFSLFQMEG
ncbi:MAG: hypothetical protein ACE5JX_04070 [Acidobacteriota bacterium]